MSLDCSSLKAGIARLHEAAIRDFDKLNEADAALGDGDLGITLKRGMELVTQAADELPDDLGKALLQCARAFTKSSGSSYGTLMATGLMAMAKNLKGKTSIEAAGIAELTELARDAMQARGKAELGGKTVLDSLDAIASATAGKQSAEEIAMAAAGAVDHALDVFRDKQASIGRARMFGEKTIGMDDPGMLAMQTIVKALTNQ
jgi:dihydroxyacetone kinase-like protein